MRRIFTAFLLVALCLGIPFTGSFASDEREASSPRTIWRLLDYIAVDYRGAVVDGRVVSEGEYAEMVEFAKAAQTQIAALPDNAAKSLLLISSGDLMTAITRKDAADAVAKRARALARDLLAAYPVPLSPSRVPDPARGAALYSEHCARCHGAAGHGDGPAAPGIDPPPTAFTDVARARERSIFGLYQVIDQGLDGTSMPSFDFLSPDERWALAFHVGRFAYPKSDADEGAYLWKSSADLRSALSGLDALTGITQAELAERIGNPDARSVMVFLRNSPEAAISAPDSPLFVAKTKLAESLTAYRLGDRRKSQELALSAYLDGFEIHEVVLKVRDPDLVRQIEQTMAALRSAIGVGAPLPDVQAQIQNATAFLVAAEQVLRGSEATAGASFVGAFTILLREGLEALLVVVAMLAFLAKTERKDLTGYVHLGWFAALAAGLLTWVVATHLIAISGAGREITEGLGAILAVLVLGLIGIWMHGKSQADAWQRYIREKMSRALSKRSAWFLFLLAFLVVYREVFETILFYIALWSQGHPVEILLGAGLGMLSLVAIAWALMRLSRRLPTERLFLYSSLLIAFLAVVLAGKGVAALQEAGWLDVDSILLAPRLEILGLYPTWEGISAQLLTLACLAAAYWRNTRAAVA